MGQGDTDFKDYIIYFLLIGVAVVSVIGFGSKMAQNYGLSDSVMKTDKIDFSRIEAQVNQTSADANSWGNAFRNDNFFVSLGAIVLFSLWGIGKLIWSAIISFFTIFFDGASSLIGIPPIVVGVLLAILIVSLIFALWRTVKQG